MFALVRDNQIIRTTNEQSFDWNGFSFSNAFLLSPEERLDHGIYTMSSEVLTPPEGMKAQGSTFAIVGDLVVEAPIYVTKTPEELAAEQAALLKTYEAALDTYLDSVAQGYRFKDRHSLAIRAGYPSQYQALAIAFGEWMEACNTVAYQGLQDVMDGKRTLPTIEGMIAELPAWVAP